MNKPSPITPKIMAAAVQVEQILRQHKCTFAECMIAMGVITHHIGEYTGDVPATIAAQIQILSNITKSNEQPSTPSNQPPKPARWDRRVTFGDDPETPAADPGAN